MVDLLNKTDLFSRKFWGIQLLVSSINDYLWRKSNFSRVNLFFKLGNVERWYFLLPT